MTMLYCRVFFIAAIGCERPKSRFQTIRGSQKRGAGAVKVNIDETAVLAPEPDRSIVALDEALSAFSQVAPRQCKVVELRYFGGLTEEEIAEVLRLSPRTVRRDWEFAKAWLMRELRH